MDHRNKIQSLVLPTDDPEDASDCITEYGPCTCEYGVVVPYSTDPSEVWGFHQIHVAFSLPGAAGIAE